MYSLVHNQVRVSPTGELLSLDYNAVSFIFELYAIECSNRKELFEQVVTCFEIVKELAQ